MTLSRPTRTTSSMPDGSKAALQQDTRAGPALRWSQAHMVEVGRGRIVVCWAEAARPSGRGGLTSDHSGAEVARRAGRRNQTNNGASTGGHSLGQAGSPRILHSGDAQTRRMDGQAWVSRARPAWPRRLGKQPVGGCVRQRRQSVKKKSRVHLA